MFKKIHHKLSIGISLFIVLIVIIENIIIFISFKKIIYQNFENSVNESCRLAYSNIESYVLLTTSYVDNTISNESFLDDVKNHQFNLNSLKIPSLNILGITLYTNNNLYYSDGLGGIVNFEKFKQDQFFYNFYQNDNLKQLIFIRDDEDLINNNYLTNVKFDKSYGVISCIWKIFKDDNVEGYLFVDLNLKEIYHTFFVFDSLKELKNSKTYLKDNNGEYLCLDESSDLKNISPSKYLINYNNYENSLLEIITITPRSNYQGKMIEIYLPIFIISLLIIILGIIIGLKYAKKITNSLTNLNLQMQDIDVILEKKLENRQQV